MELDQARQATRKGEVTTHAGIREMDEACSELASRKEQTEHWRFLRALARVATEVAGHHDAHRLPTKVAEDLLSTIYIGMIHSVNNSPDGREGKVPSKDRRDTLEERMADSDE